MARSFHLSRGGCSWSPLRRNHRVLLRTRWSLYENNNNSINATQPQTSNALCDVWRAQTRAAENAWRQTLCLSTRNLCHHRARAPRKTKKKQGAYNSTHLQSMLQHDRATAGGDTNVETKRCLLCTTTRSKLLHGTPRNQQT